MLFFRQPFDFLFFARECLRVKALFFPHRACSPNVARRLFIKPVHQSATPSSRDMLSVQSFIDGKPSNGGTMPQTVNCLVS